MSNQKIFLMLNITFIIVILLLLLPLFDVSIPTIGKAQYIFDQTEPACYVNFKEDFTPWFDLDRCCLESRKQVNCWKDSNMILNEKVDWRCQTGSGDTVGYLLNNKAYRYCQQQPIW